MPLPGTLIIDKPQDPEFLTETRLIRTPTSFADATSARLGNSFKATIIYNIFNARNLSLALRGDPISKDDDLLGKSIWQDSAYFRPDLEYRPQMTWEYARLLAMHSDTKLRRQSRIERGPDGFRGFSSAVIGFTGAFADPINFIPIVNGTRTIQMASQAFRGASIRAGTAFASGGLRRLLPLKLGSQALRQFAKASKGLGIRDAVTRKAFTRIGITAFDAMVTEAAAQPIIAHSFALSQEPYDVQVMMANMATAFGVGSAFGALGAGVRKWSTSRKIRGLQKAVEDEMLGRETDVGPTVRGDPQEPRANMDAATEQVTSLKERLFAMDEAKVRMLATSDPQTSSGRIIKSTFHDINLWRLAARELGVDHPTVKELGASVDDAIRNNPQIATAIDNLESYQNLTPNMVDNLEGFGFFGRPTRDVLPDMTMKQIEDVSPVSAERIQSRVEAMQEELRLSEEPKLIKVDVTPSRPSGKIWTKSTRPMWMQNMRDMGIFNNYKELDDAIHRIVTGTETEGITARMKVIPRTIKAVKEHAMRDLEEGFDANEALAWIQHQRTDGPDPEFLTEMRKLDGDTVGDSDMKYVSIEEPEPPSTDSFIQAQRNADQFGQEKVVDDQDLPSTEARLKEAEEQFRAERPEEFETIRPERVAEPKERPTEVTDTPETPDDALTDIVLDSEVNNLGRKYKFVNLDVETKFNDKVFFHGTKANMKSLSQADPGATSKVENLFGIGLYLTDNPIVGRGYSRAGRLGGAGKVFAAKLKDAKLIDLDLPADPRLRKTLEAFEIDGEPIGKLEGKTGADIFESFKDRLIEAEMPSDEALDLFQDIAVGLKREGIDGFKHIGGRRVGKKFGDHNVAILFPDFGAGRALDDIIDPGISVKDVTIPPGEIPTAPARETIVAKRQEIRIADTEIKQARVMEQRGYEIIKNCLLRG